MQEIGHSDKSSPGEVFLSDELEARVHLVAVDKPCTVLLGGQAHQPLPQQIVLRDQHRADVFFCKLKYLAGSGLLSFV